VQQLEKQDHRFPTTVRLLSPLEFKRVFAKPQKIKGPGFSLFVRENGLSHPRLGLAIPKKAVKLSVGRNRIKRLVRESFRHHQDEMIGVDIVFLAYKGVDVQPNNDMMCALMKAWQRVAK
jgi:ribonuclease P protein component